MTGRNAGAAVVDGEAQDPPGGGGLVPHLDGDVPRPAVPHRVGHALLHAAEYGQVGHVAVAAGQALEAPGEARPGVTAPEIAQQQIEAFRQGHLPEGVRPQPVLKRARRVYLLAAQVDRAPDVRLVSQRPAVPRVKHTPVAEVSPRLPNTICMTLTAVPKSSGILLALR